jgi:ABC-type glycerol-3-phosphate transport system substrate-binding protein
MKMTNFQLIFTGLFVVFIIVGIIAFSLFTVKQNSVGAVTIWGTLDQTIMQQLVSNLSRQDRSFQNVTYVQKTAGTYIPDVINAMASGVSPDIILLSQDQIAQFSDKIQTISYSAVSQSTYTSSYIYESQIFLNQSGTVALPFLINPMVMYWNRDLFTTAGLAQPPQSWNDLLTEAQKLSVLDASKNVKQSAIALGSWDNILYAKQILSTLFMQAGDYVVVGYPGSMKTVFGSTPQGAVENPAGSALQFYTEFANPSKVTYSWNRSLPTSQDAFTAGQLAIYLGFASDYPTIRARNPNINVGVAMIPQLQNNTTHLTYGQLIGLAIPRTAVNAQGALTIAEKLSSQTGAAAAAQAFGLPPVRLDVQQNNTGNAVNDVLYQSALISRGWLDPNPSATNDIFKNMIEEVTSNQSLPNTAILEATQSIRALAPDTQPAQ